jgi:chromosome segregation ATPase
MAKAVVTQDAVFAEADALVARGEEPSIIAVQARIGGGSYSTVKRMLDAWKAERASPAPRVAVPEAVLAQNAGFVQQLRAAALAIADQQATQLRGELERELQGTRAQLAEAEQVIARLESEAESQRAQLVSTQQQVSEQQTELAAIRATVQGRDAQIQELQQQGALLLRQLEQSQDELRQVRTVLIEQARLEGELTATRQQLAEQRALIERLTGPTGQA